MKHRWLPPGFAQRVASNTVTLPGKEGWERVTGLGALPSRLSCLIRESFRPFSPTPRGRAEGRFGMEELCGRISPEYTVPLALSVPLSLFERWRLGLDRWLWGQQLSSLALPGYL